MVAAAGSSTAETADALHSQALLQCQRSAASTLSQLHTHSDTHTHTLTVWLDSTQGVEVAVPHNHHMGVAWVCNQLIAALPWQPCGAEEVGILAHVQREGLPQVGHVPGEGAGHQPGGKGLVYTASHTRCRGRAGTFSRLGGVL